MMIRPLGWELALFLVLLATAATGILLDMQAVVIAASLGCAIATPLVLISLVARFVAAILDESRRHRTLRRAG